MPRLISRILTLIGLFFLLAILAVGMHPSPPVTAQLSLPQTLEETLPAIFAPSSEEETTSAWVRLDGKPLFRIAGIETELPERMQAVQKNLRNIHQHYLGDREGQLNIEIRVTQSLPVLYVNDRYLLTITHIDARLQGSEPAIYAETLKNTLIEGFQASQVERSPQQLRKKLQWTGAIFLGATLLSGSIIILPGIFQKKEENPAETVDTRLLTIRFNLKQRKNLSAIGRQLQQLAQTALWLTTALSILSLFPQTRMWQIVILARIKSYLVAGSILILTYISIRFSYILIDRSIAAFVESAEIVSKRSSQRLQQRVTTISSVTKSISTILLSITGILLTLLSLGVDIAPLLAGAGLIGVAISLASQNIIKDAINGFLILAEDQYAVGDVIVVGEVFGLVENISLRITQLRDPEMRLITIPNSEITIVSNLSSRRSQADIKIPFSYSVDIDKALDIVEQVGEELARDPDWQEFILAKPEILGLDEFSDRAAIVRVWIATQPLKQWDVGREFRRRLKRACDRDGIPLSLGREEVWLHADRGLSDARSKTRNLQDSTAF